MQNVDGLGGEVARLVETALGLARTVQRHGHDENFGRRRFVHFRSHLRDGGGEAGSKLAGEGGNALEFESVDGPPQRPVVFAETDSADKGRWRQAASAAEALRG